MALSLYCFGGLFLFVFLTIFFLNYSTAMLFWGSRMPKSYVMFVWKIKFYSCVVRLLSYWLHRWNLIFRRKVHNVFRNPSWCRKFHFDVNSAFLCSKTPFYNKRFDSKPFVTCYCVYHILDSRRPLKSHACTWAWAFLSWSRVEYMNL